MLGLYRENLSSPCCRIERSVPTVTGSAYPLRVVGSCSCGLLFTGGGEYSSDHGSLFFTPLKDLQAIDYQTDPSHTEVRT